MKKDNILYIHKVLSISKLVLVLALGYVIAGKVLLPERIKKGLVPASALGGDKACVRKTIEAPVLSQEDYADIIERNPFGTSDQTNTGKRSSMSNPTGSWQSASEELGLALFGTISGSPPVSRAVIKDLKTSELDLYKIGQTVRNSRIEGIDTDTVTLVRNGERKILGLNNGKYSSNDDNNARASSCQTSNNSPSGVKTNSPQEQNPVKIQTRIGHVEAILKKALIELCFADNRVEGLRITGLENIPAAKHIGLRNGDVIRMVNGHRLTSKQKAYQIFKKARSQATMNLELLRGNETKRFSFSLQ